MDEWIMDDEHYYMKNTSVEIVQSKPALQSELLADNY